MVLMKFRKQHYRAQVDTRDCGVAALAMIFGYYGSYFSLATLREKAKTTNDGTTALGLVKVAEGLNFETRAFKADMSLFDLEEVSYPFIAHILKDGKLLHYYVVTGQDKHSIHIADPDPQVKTTPGRCWWKSAGAPGPAPRCSAGQPDPCSRPPPGRPEAAPCRRWCASTSTARNRYGRTSG